MIAIPRRRLRALRPALRRAALGLPRRGPAPPLTLLADPAAGLRLRFVCEAIALEISLPGRVAAAEALALPLEALAEVEGPADAPVTFEAAGPGRTLARWDDRGLPQRAEYAAPGPGATPPFPEPPASFAQAPPGLLKGLAAASEVAGEDSPRFDLRCLRLGGPAGEVAATDGRQLLLQRVGPLPWADEVLLRAVPLLGSPALPRDRPASVGRTGSHVVLRLGDWALWLPIRAGARFPRIDGVVPPPPERATRLHLDPADAAFLRAALDRLPGAEAEHAPATLELNGRVAVRAREGDVAAELVLARSSYEGPPLRLATDRRYLARAAALGLRTIELAGADRPAVAADGARTYCWQPLSPDAAVPPEVADARVESTAILADVRRRPEPPRSPMIETDGRNGHAEPPPPAPEPASGVGAPDPRGRGAARRAGRGAAAGRPAGGGVAPAPPAVPPGPRDAAFAAPAAAGRGRRVGRAAAGRRRTRRDEPPPRWAPAASAGRPRTRPPESRGDESTRMAAGRAGPARRHDPGGGPVAAARRARAPRARPAGRAAGIPRPARRGAGAGPPAGQRLRLAAAEGESRRAVAGLEARLAEQRRLLPELADELLGLSAQWRYLADRLPVGEGGRHAAFAREVLLGTPFAPPGRRPP